ncbi:hypothetical protein C7410_15326 [Paraburkholderia silvatlantica]|uniref:Uncharacterized protein n=1 Tax=Paraburkholderia silvatlantica TaxID=321895 RepID=A0A2V4THM4_9BURK|nr:hypothetical protein C7410_15326 [Paraburkholderia silvatlantica]
MNPHNRSNATHGYNQYGEFLSQIPERRRSRMYYRGIAMQLTNTYLTEAKRPRPLRETDLLGS